MSTHNALQWHDRVKKSGSAGEQLKEAQAINKSLSALGDVIAALAGESVSFLCVGAPCVSSYQSLIARNA